MAVTEDTEYEMACSLIWEQFDAEVAELREEYNQRLVEIYHRANLANEEARRRHLTRVDVR